MKLNRVLRLGLVLVVTVSSAFAQKKSVNPIKVFVGANTNGFSDERSDSARDLAKDLYKNSMIIPATSVSDADVTVEVTDRQRVDGSSQTTASIYTRLTAGHYSTNIEGVYNGLPFTKVWSLAAGDAARKIENWIRSNYNNLLARRTQK